MADTIIQALSDHGMYAELIPNTFRIQDVFGNSRSYCPRCKRVWSSHITWIKFDLRGQRVVKNWKQRCTTCDQDVNPYITKEELYRMGCLAVKRAQALMSGTWRPMDHTRRSQPHDTTSCEKCQAGSQPCWIAKRKPPQPVQYNQGSAVPYMVPTYLQEGYHQSQVIHPAGPQQSPMPHPPGLPQPSPTAPMQTSTPTSAYRAPYYQLPYYQPVQYVPATNSTMAVQVQQPNEDAHSPEDSVEQLDVSMANLNIVPCEPVTSDPNQAASPAPSTAGQNDSDPATSSSTTSNPETFSQFPSGMADTVQAGVHGNGANTPVSSTKVHPMDHQNYMLKMATPHTQAQLGPAQGGEQTPLQELSNMKMERQQQIYVDYHQPNVYYPQQLQQQQLPQQQLTQQQPTQQQLLQLQQQQKQLAQQQLQHQQLLPQMTIQMRPQQQQISQHAMQHTPCQQNHYTPTQAALYPVQMTPGMCVAVQSYATPDSQGEVHSTSDMTMNHVSAPYNGVQFYQRPAGPVNTVQAFSTPVTPHSAQGQEYSSTYIQTVVPVNPSFHQYVPCSVTYQTPITPSLTPVTQHPSTAVGVPSADNAIPFPETINMTSENKATSVSHDGSYQTTLPYIDYVESHPGTCAAAQKA